MQAQLAYSTSRQDTLNELVLGHAGLVKRIAQHLIARLPASVQLDDLIQAGMLGLIEAARNYDASHGASFETYAGIRIRGAILDETRKSDWTPRSVHRKAREMTETVRRLEHEHGRVAEPQEVAATMNISMNDYHAIVTDAAGSRVLSLDQPESGVRELGDIPSVTNDDPSAHVENDHFRQALVEVIDHLPEKERLVMSLYYERELNLREIGEILGVSESRICQIHGQALVRIRARMRDWLSSESG